jgi:HD-GYP domain-containing protein (c-di-GMP phosphodiesterase class II)
VATGSVLNVHRILLRRLALSWLLISVLAGGGMFIYGIEKIDERLVDLAIAESRKLSSDTLPLLAAPAADRTALDRLADDFLRQHFIVIELYNRDHQKLVEKVNPRYEAVEKILKQKVHQFPQDKEFHYQRFSVNEETVLQVLVPLKDTTGTIVGYFEGVFVIDRQALEELNRDLQISLLTTLVTVLLTTLVIYPVVVSLNRDVVRYSHDLLLGNIELMEVLGSAIAKRDSDTNIHNYRVSIYAVRLAEKAGLSNEAIRNLIAGAFLHDVGKIGISDNILLKPARLTAEEFSVMKTHVTLGVDILAKSNWLQTGRDVVECHHEKFDGSGYMRGLKGEAIPINARIFAVVDVFDALTSQRPYKMPMPFAEAIAILQRDAGTHFDPRLVKLFVGIAAPLHQKISATPDAEVEKLLQHLITQYFFAG